MNADVLFKGIDWRKGETALEIPYSVSGVSTIMLLSCARRHCIVECGDGASIYLYSKFGRGQEEYSAIDAVFLTHEHMDHAGGLISFLLLLEVAGRKKELLIYSPAGREGVVADLVERVAGQVSFNLRLMNPLEAASAGGVPEWLSFHAFETVHRDNYPSRKCSKTVRSCGYSIRTMDASLVFSGDTGPCPQLERECAGVDCAVIESTWEEKNPCPGLHLTIQEARHYASLAAHGILIHPLRREIR